MYMISPFQKQTRFYKKNFFHRHLSVYYTFIFNGTACRQNYTHISFAKIFIFITNKYISPFCLPVYQIILIMISSAEIYFCHSWYSQLANAKSRGIARKPVRAFPKNLITLICKTIKWECTSVHEKATKYADDARRHTYTQLPNIITLLYTAIIKHRVINSKNK